MLFCTFPSNSSIWIKSVVICYFSTGAWTDIRYFTYLWLCYFLKALTKNQTCFQKIPWCPMSPKEHGTGLSGAQGMIAMAQTRTEPRPWEIFAFSAAQEVGCGQCWAQEPGFTFHFCIRAWEGSVPRHSGACCVGTSCPLTALLDPCTCFVPQKGHQLV